ncbi:MAG TPA: TonB-dependent receptor [Chthoniobacterales bacterium]|nr:TonB-dependent receptor [Chthoniobacterales bacterium]
MIIPKSKNSFSTWISVWIAANLFLVAMPTQGQTSTAADAGQVDQNGNPLPAGNTASAERVIVTGSNIPSAEEVGPNPVDTYGRDSIAKRGLPTTEEFLRDLPIANANGVATSNNENGSNTAVGAASVALRGFDSRATLVLLDGRRVTPYPFGNNPGLFSNAMFVDLNSIPQAAIESIEILKDGASTTYGADAVAGVVNIKMRHMYNGSLASIEYGNSTKWDSDEFSTSLVYGVGDDKTSILGVVSYYSRNPIANRDRSFSAVPPFLSSNASPYNLQLSGLVAGAVGGMNLAPVEFAAAPDFTNGSAPASAYKYNATSRLNHYNFNLTSWSLPDSERYGNWLSAERKLFEDQMVVYLNGFYQNVKTENQAAPPATGSFQTKGQTILAIPPHAPIAPGAEPPNTPTHAETGVPADAFNHFNPFDQIISGGTRARLAEFGNRIFDNETDAWLSTLGIKGDKLFDGSWGYDAGWRYSQIKNVQTGRQVSASLFNRILNEADPIFDPASPQFIGTTVPFNPFGDYRVPIPSNAATVNFATVHPKDEDISKLTTLDATVYTTDLYDLPAGGIGFAVGGQFRRENLEEDPDRLNEIGDIIGNSPVQPVHGGRKSFAFYSELQIPIFSPDKNAIPGFRALEFVASARFEDFENNDTNVLVPKVGIRWQPFDEQLTLRATWGEGFREPSLEELYSAPVSTLEVSHDPLKGGLFESETNVLITSNRNLQPEDSRSFSGGFVYTPKPVPGLTFNADFWDIERTGVVFAPTADQVLNGGAPGVVERDQGGFITRIVVANENFGAQTARGVDLGLQYQRETQWGTFTSLTQATHLYEFFFPLYGQGFPGEFHGNLAGVTTDPGASNEGWYRWRGFTRLDWTWKGIDLNTTCRYIDGFKEHRPDAIGVHYVKQRFLFDGQLSYDLTALLPVQENPVAGQAKSPKDLNRAKDGSLIEPAAAQTANFRDKFFDRLLRGTIVTVGCNNIFDTDPPFAFGEGGNAVGYPAFTYDATGRFAYVRVLKKF